MQFDFFSPRRIHFGTGTFEKLPELCASKGRRFLILTGGSSFKQSGMQDKLSNLFENNGLKFKITDGLSHEPEVEDIDRIAEEAKHFEPDAVLAIGGGSVIDAGKALSGLLPNGGSVRDYLEGVGNQAMAKDPLPFIAVPTTAGTGTEATKNAVISSAREGFKKSMRDDRLLPALSLIDPLLTVSAPKSVTASSGMDAICQLIESYTTVNPNPFCDALALRTIPAALRSILRAYHAPEDVEAREQMSLAALTSGLCLANAGLGAAHGFAAGFGVILGLPHGLCCGVLLPHVMRYNFERGVARYADIANVLLPFIKNDNHAVLRMIERIESINSEIGIPYDFKYLKIPQDKIEALAKASMGSSMKKNPIELSLEDCIRFIKAIV